MAVPRTVTVYSDYKSPYAYLAKDLGYARLDESGRVVEQARNAHQWRRVRYSYMDCRRQARKRGLVIRGPQKIWDSTLAAAGLLFAKRQGEAVLRQYHDIIFARFWKRELDIELASVIAAVLAEAGADTAGLAD